MAADEQQAADRYGDFPPEQEVHISGLTFIRSRDVGPMRGGIAVWDSDQQIGRMLAGFTTEKEALAWLEGYRCGHKNGERIGRIALQGELCTLLGVKGG